MEKSVFLFSGRCFVLPSLQKGEEKVWRTETTLKLKKNRVEVTHPHANECTSGGEKRGGGGEYKSRQGLQECTLSVH